MSRLVAILVLSLMISTGTALSNTPPPTPLPKPSSPFSKGPTIELAAFTNVQSTNDRELQRGGTYDTRDYCFALIDIGADPGTSASLVITGYDDFGPNKYAVFPVENFMFPGKAASSAEGTIIETHMIPLLHPETSFAVRLTPESAKAMQGELHVYMTPLPCAYDPRQPTGS